MAVDKALITDMGMCDDMQYTLYQLLYFFFIYGFLGWNCEVVFAAFKTGGFVNRGFLLGPICPIYGFGVIAVLCLLEPIKDRPVAVYILSVFVTSAIELIVGVFAEKLLHERLWDYSGNAFNIGGYVCLTFSLLWGIGCMIVVYAVHPLVCVLISKIPRVVGIVILSLLSAAILSDTVITTFHALSIDSRMRAIDELSEALENVSDRIGKELSDKAVMIRCKTKESESLQAKYQALVEKRNIIHDHLFKTFDNLKSGKYKSAYEKILKSRIKK